MKYAMITAVSALAFSLPVTGISHAQDAGGSAQSNAQTSAGADTGTSQTTGTTTTTGANAGVNANTNGNTTGDVTDRTPNRTGGPVRTTTGEIDPSASQQYENQSDDMRRSATRNGTAANGYRDDRARSDVRAGQDSGIGVRADEDTNIGVRADEDTNIGVRADEDSGIGPDNTRTNTGMSQQQRTGVRTDTNGVPSLNADER